MMKKTYITWLLVMAAGTYMSGQIGIGTDIPKATLDVSGKSTDPKVLDGLIPPRIKGNDLKAKDNLYGNEQVGTIVYVTEIPNPTSAKTINIKSTGFYYFGGAGVWVAFKEAGQPSTDAARFLGGTVYVKFDNSSGGTLPNNRVIQNNSGTYSVGSLTGQSARVGGVMTMNGNGYKISNPAQGI
ncbi:hypothetical protein QWZ06_15825 [Chryseobacterium tructae]|nr:hypothetical protein [Chryseobacterium tructae]MDN3693654.1 hypothetical protein [Chryseobacterium tructae]